MARLLAVAVHLVAFTVFSGVSAAQTVRPETGVKDPRQRLIVEGGVFGLSKEQGEGPAFGVGYGLRPVRGLELGLGVRYFLLPDRTTDSFVASPVGATSPPQRYVEPGFHYGLLRASLRGYLPLDGSGQVELGLSLGGGAIVGSSARRCCKQYEIGLAPDVRVRVWRNTALELAPELAVGSTGLKNGPNTEDMVDEIFLQESLWLSVVQGF